VIWLIVFLSFLDAAPDCWFIVGDIVWELVECTVSEEFRYGLWKVFLAVLGEDESTLGL
jgi:hypothetical protein